MVLPVSSSSHPSYAWEITGGCVAIALAVATIALALLGKMGPYLLTGSIAGGTVSLGLLLASLGSFLCKRNAAGPSPLRDKTPSRTLTTPSKTITPQVPEKVRTDSSRDRYTSLLYPFYLAEGRDFKGRTFDEILKRMENDYQWVEETHDWVQWVFPLKEKSGAVGSDPELRPDMAQLIKTTPLAIERAKRAFNLYLNFLGLKYNEEEKAVEILNGDALLDLAFWNNGAWSKSSFSHNHLRFTRIIKFLTLIGLTAEAKAFNDVLQKIAARCADVFHINKNSSRYWREALIYDDSFRIKPTSSHL